ncbi:MAG: hypothetical protein ACRC45_02570, partial [Cetobacterium sp.]
MADRFKLARAMESEITQFAEELNDYTLLLSKDTSKLYTVKDKKAVLVGGGGGPVREGDIPITKSLSVWGINEDDYDIRIGQMVGVVANEDGTYRITLSQHYDGELLGQVESERITNDGHKQFQVNLLTNLVVYQAGSEKLIKEWDPVYIGILADRKIVSVCDPTVLADVFGIAGVVSEVLGGGVAGRYSYNAFILQTSFFISKDTGNLLHTVLADLVENIYTKSESDEKFITRSEFEKVRDDFEKRISELEKYKPKPVNFDWT